MLLVDDGDGEPGEADVGLDQRVGADDQPELARLEDRQRAAPVRGRGRAGQQRRRQRHPAEQPLERREVLVGERLGRRHQRRLLPRLERSQHRVEGDHRLAGADLAHQQPLHRPLGGEVGVDLGEGPHLVRGRLERKRAQPVADERARLVERHRGPALVALAAAQCERRLMQEELLVGEPHAGRVELRGVVGEVGRDPGVGGAGERVRVADRGRERLGDVAGPSQRLPRPLPQLLRAQALGGGMGGHHPGRVDARRNRAVAVQRARPLDRPRRPRRRCRGPRSSRRGSRGGRGGR